MVSRWLSSCSCGVSTGTTKEARLAYIRPAHTRKNEEVPQYTDMKERIQVSSPDPACHLAYLERNARDALMTILPREQQPSRVHTHPAVM